MLYSLVRGLPPATVAWLSTPLPCSVNSPAGGKKNPFVYGTAPQEARRQLIAKLEAEAGGKTMEEMGLGEPFCFAWPESGEWVYKYWLTIYQCGSTLRCPSWPT